MSTSRAASKPCSAKWRSAVARILARVSRPLLRWRTGLGAADLRGITLQLYWRASKIIKRFGGILGGACIDAPVVTRSRMIRARATEKPDVPPRRPDPDLGRRPSRHPRDAARRVVAPPAQGVARTRPA